MVKVPGFRSGTPWKMLVALIGYAFIILVILTTVLPLCFPVQLDSPAPTPSSTTPQASQPAVQSNTNTPEKAAREILGEANKTGNGVVNVAFYARQGDLPSRLNIIYHYNPIRNQIKPEIGIHFSRKIKEMYERAPELDHMVFNIQAPATDKYGNTAWTKAVSFKMTRAIYNKIKWSNFADDRLLDVAEDVWIAQQLK